MNRVCDLCFKKISIANANIKLSNNNSEDINVKNIKQKELLINNSNLDGNISSNKRSKSNVTFSPQLEEIKTEYAVLHIPIEDQFSKAQHLLKNGPKIDDPSTETKLKIYGLFKQSTAGPCDDSVKVPGMFDPIGRSKYMSWKSYKDMPKDKAMKDYVSLINSLMPKSFIIESNQTIVADKKNDDDGDFQNRNSNNISNDNVKFDNTNEIYNSKLNSSPRVAATNSTTTKVLAPSEILKNNRGGTNCISTSTSNSSIEKPSSSGFNIFNFVFWGVIIHYSHVILLSLSYVHLIQVPSISSLLNDYSVQLPFLETYNWHILLSFDYIQLYYRTLISLCLVLLVIGLLLLFIFIASIGFFIIYFLAETYTGGLKSVYIKSILPSPKFIDHFIILMSSIGSYQCMDLLSNSNIDEFLFYSITILFPVLTVLIMDKRNNRVEEFINLNNSTIKSTKSCINRATTKGNDNKDTNINLNDIHNVLNKNKIDSNNKFFQPELPSNKSDSIVWLTDNILIHCFAGFSLGISIYISIHFILYKFDFNGIYEIIFGKLINHISKYWMDGIYNTDLFIHQNNIINNIFFSLRSIVF
jgi:acyl-CoA-binding protein